MIAVLLAILLLLLIVALPTWPYSRTWGWGYYPSSGFGIPAADRDYLGAVHLLVNRTYVAQLKMLVELPT